MTSSLVSTIAQYAIVALVVIGAIVLCALGSLSATVTAGILGVALGHGATVLGGKSTL